MTEAELTKARKTLSKGLCILAQKIHDKIDRGERLSTGELQAFQYMCKTSNISLVKGDYAPNTVDEALEQALLNLQQKPFSVAQD